MNGIEAIEKEIFAEAEARAQEIIAHAETQAEEITAQAQAQADEDYAAAAAQSNAAADAVVAREKQSAAQLAKKQVASSRQKLVYGAFDEAFRQLASLSDERYFALLEKLAQQAVLKDGELVLNEADRKKYGEKLSAAVKLPLAKDFADIPGGVIVRSGRVENNASLEIVVREARERMSYYISQLLFS